MRAYHMRPVIAEGAARQNAVQAIGSVLSACVSGNRIYFNGKGGRPGIISPKGVAIDHNEFPADWFEGLRPEQYRGRRYDKSLNKYGVRSSRAS